MGDNQVVVLIKNWITYDEKIKQLQKEIANNRKEKKVLTEKLTQIMKSNNIDEFDINKGKLVYNKVKTKAPLSKKHLLTSLTQFYKNDNEMVEELTKFIMESREEVTKDQIKHKD
jgi:phage gpG-like protein